MALTFTLTATLFLSTLGSSKHNTDSLFDKGAKDIQEVVVSATKSERNIQDLPIPVVLIQAKQIQQNGMIRLDQVLNEQTGLTITSDHGKGVQIQGLDADYTLIMVDGEPLIGRTAGTLDLNRIAVGGIERIEIIKGPSSALYGSEALAGVINIITKKPYQGLQANAYARYGTNETKDFSTQLLYKHKSFSTNIFLNRNSSGGYKFFPDSAGYTVGPYQTYTGQVKVDGYVSNKIKLGLSSRYYTEKQFNEYKVLGSLVDDRGQVTDFSLNPSLQASINNKLNTILKLYSALYQTESQIKSESDGSLFDSDFFKQRFNRAENQWIWATTNEITNTVGAGFLVENLESTRYSDAKEMRSSYLYVQSEYAPISNLNIIAAFRYDTHSAYKNQLSPKLSAKYKINDNWSIQGSIGRGYKAPDFRQLYLNFTNNIVGYSVFGTQEIKPQLEKLEAQQQISSITIDPATVKSLDAESSWAGNISVNFKPNKQTELAWSVFQNDIQNLIDTKTVAIKKNGQSVFSYFNINHVITRGFELNAKYLYNDFTFRSGYQYLDAYDKDVIRDIDAGKISYRDQSYNTFLVTRKNYGGLFGRSHHSANLAITYENTKNHWDATVRVIYRSKFGIGDKNGNLILDQDNEYAKGYYTCNVTLSKLILHDQLRVQAIVENIFNYTDKNYLPYVPGRLVNIAVSYTFNKPYTKK